MNNNTISVVFADSSHAHYAPRICDLIYESALQRGTGIAKRSPEYIAAKMTGGKSRRGAGRRETGRVQLHRVLGARRFRRHLGTYRGPRVPTHGTRGTDQATNIRAGPTTIPVRQVIQYYDVAARDETQFAHGLHAGDLFRAHRGRGVLAGLPGVLQLRHPATQQPAHVPLHGYALRPCQGTAAATVPAGPPT